ncbi:MAG TPA: flagellar biosynthetic protein FliO [Bryobacteraceae bacterium]|nr:flagellar biosynthetic protein FliO [Bryobacteraceae bacterium]
MELRQFFSILLVFALLGAALWVLRRGAAGGLRVTSPFGKRASRAKGLMSIERLVLTPQHSLHIVRIQGREVVVATHPHGCTLLTEASQGPQT